MRVCVCVCVQIRQRAASTAVFLARIVFDRITSYNLDSMNEQKWLRRFLFLETVAGGNLSVMTVIIGFRQKS